MIIYRLWRRWRAEKGFTLVHVVAVMAIAGLIGLGAMIATVQVFGQVTRNSDYNTASRNAMTSVS